MVTNTHKGLSRPGLLLPSALSLSSSPAVLETSLLLCSSFPAPFNFREVSLPDNVTQTVALHFVALTIQKRNRATWNIRTNCCKCRTFQFIADKTKLAAVWPWRLTTAAFNEMLTVASSLHAGSLPCIARFSFTKFLDAAILI